MQNNYNEILKNDKIKIWLQNVCVDRYNTDNIEENMIQTYIQDMRNNSTWGGAPEIAITSKLFNVKILVNYNNNHMMEFNNSDIEPNNTLYIHWTGGHYTPIYKK